jgi:heat shock factor-binding protein 1
MASDPTSSSPNNNRQSVNSVSFEPPSPNHVPLILKLQTTTDASAPAELSAVVDELLNSLSNKFAGVSSEIFAKSKLILNGRGNFGPTLA